MRRGLTIAVSAIQARKRRSDLQVPDPSKLEHPMLGNVFLGVMPVSLAILIVLATYVIML